MEKALWEIVGSPWVWGFRDALGQAAHPDQGARQPRQARAPEMAATEKEIS